VGGGEVSEDLVRTLLPPPPEERSETLDLAAAVAEAERKAILRALAATNDDKPKAAARLGIGERTLWTKLKKHGL
jgi:two-component system response regulator PilR (NtrC family)